jgi:pimeloyl-ACP methyl ester carboxylesterase
MPWRETPAELERARHEQPEIVATALGDLFGILTPPDPAAPATGRAVILLTRPRSHRNRMWVEAARRLALEGHHAFRFDYHGCGDSSGASAYLNPNQPYREDVVAVIRHLRDAHGIQRFVVVGSCFDARTALSAFQDEAAALDGLVFMAAPVVDLDHLALARADQRNWMGLAGTLRNPENWRALVKPERWRYMARMLGRMASNSMRGPESAGDPPLAESFREHFRALVKSEARALFLYGRDDDEYRSFEVAERREFVKSSPAVRARLEIEVWPGHVHGILAVPRQREALERVLAWIRTLSAAPIASPNSR